MGHGGRSLDVNLKDQDNLQILGFHQNIKAAEVSKLIYPKAKIAPGSTSPYRLPDAPCLAVHLTAKSDNTDAVWVGGINALEARVDYGYPLLAGDSFTLKPENANLITLLAENATDIIYCTIKLVQASEPTFTDSLPVIIDTTAPTVSSVSPVNGSSGIARNTQVYGIFSEDIDPVSVDATSFTITGGTVPTINRYVDPTNNKKVVMEFASDLSATQLMTATFKGTGGSRIKDLAGNTLAADHVWTFTTGLRISSRYYTTYCKRFKSCKRCYRCRYIGKPNGNILRKHVSGVYNNIFSVGKESFRWCYSFNRCESWRR